MRPTPIPDSEVWEGASRRVLAAPDGDLTNRDIAPVEALVDRSPSTGALNLSVRCVLEGDDLAKLQAGGTVWLTFWGCMVPWSSTVVSAPDDDQTDRCGNTWEYDVDFAVWCSRPIGHDGQCAGTVEGNGGLPATFTWTVTR